MHEFWALLMKLYQALLSVNLKIEIVETSPRCGMRSFLHLSSRVVDTF